MFHILKGYLHGLGYISNTLYLGLTANKNGSVDKRRWEKIKENLHVPVLKLCKNLVEWLNRLWPPEIQWSIHTHVHTQKHSYSSQTQNNLHIR